MIIKKMVKKNINIKHKDTLILLDWDNTLFPTTWVMKNNINIENKDVKSHDKYFNSLDNMLYKLFIKLLQHGKVVIVTNALPMWVNLSTQVLPLTGEFLNKYKVKIISARKIYRVQSPNMMDWKKLAFKDQVKKEMENNNVLNIISIGDADYEYKALIDLYTLNHKKKILKSIKFLNEPSHDTLIDQLEVLYDKINEICMSKKHLDLKFNMLDVSI